MKTTLSNLRHLGAVRGQKKAFARVTVTTRRGFWRWRRITVEERMIYSEFVGEWRFVGSEELVPAEEMSRMFADNRWGGRDGQN